MKNLFYIFLFSFSSLAAQNSDGFFNAVKTNNFASITDLLDYDITYCEYDLQEFLDNKSASRRIEKFFSGKQLKSVEKVHSGSAKATKYQVFKVVTGPTVYRMFLYSEGDKITEVRIDKY